MTKKTIRNQTELRRLNTPGEYALGNGLYVEVGKVVKTFFAKPTDPQTGKRPRVTYGHFGSQVSWDDAQDMHTSLKAEIKALRSRMKSGPVPANEFQSMVNRITLGEEQAEAIEEQTGEDSRLFQGDSFHDWETKFVAHATDGLKRPEVIHDIVERFIRPFLGRNYGTEEKPLFRAVASFETKEVMDELNRIKTDNGDDPARKTLVYMGGFFKWATLTGRITNNPIGGVTRRDLKIVTNKNERRLFGSELATLLGALEASQMSEVTKLGIQILLLTGARSGELMGGQWKDFFWDEDTWVLRTTKNTSVHYIFIAPQVKKLFTRLYELTGDTGMMMGNLDEKVMTKAFARLQKPNGKGEIKMDFPAGYMNLHGLRHTFTSLLQELKIDRDVRKLLTNHKDGDAHEIYENAQLQKECKAAMKKYAAAILNVEAHDQFEEIPLHLRK